MSFEDAVEFVLKWEGGLSDHPNDPGGITNYGISIKFAGSIKFDITGDNKTTAADIRNLTRPRAKQIYKDHFWLAANCDQMPEGINLAVFDAAVNMGVRRAIMFLQMSVRTKPDGIWGPNTRAALESANRFSTLWEYQARRNRFYGKIRNFDTFGLGWMRRSADCHQTAARLLRPN